MKEELCMQVMFFTTDEKQMMEVNNLINKFSGSCFLSIPILATKNKSKNQGDLKNGIK